MDPLDRLLRRLVQNIRGGYPEYLTRPFEVAELYQVLVPYRLNRRELELETNQDYELVVTQLLAGERGYLKGDADMQQALRRELASPNPDTGAFRRFAAARVALSPDILRRLDVRPDVRPDAGRASADPPTVPISREAEPVATRPVAADTPTDVTITAVTDGATPRPALDELPAHTTTAEAPDGDSSPAPSAPRVLRPFTVASTPPAAVVPSPTASPSPQTVSPQAASPQRAVRADAAPPSPPETMTAPSRQTKTIAGGGSCRYCGGELPEGRRITFCPHCGQNLTIIHCPACSTELDVGWRFCTTCGREQG